MTEQAASNAQIDRSPIRQRPVAAYVVSTFCVTAAAAAQITALGKFVFDMTQREIDLGFLGLAQFIPAAMLVVVAGPVADRFDRRRVVQLALVFELGCALGLAWVVHRGADSLPSILALVFGLGVGRAFATPASRALPADLVERRLLPRVIPLTSLAWQSGVIVGPVMGGLLYVVNPALPFVATALLLGLGAVAMFAVQVLDSAQASHVAQAAHVVSSVSRLHEAREGFRVVRRTPMLLGAISLDLFAVLFGGAVELLPAIVQTRLGAGAAGLGWLRAAGGIGAAAVTLCLASRPLKRHVGNTLFTVVAIFGSATVVLGFTRNYWIAFLMMFVLSGADAISVFIRSTLTPLIVPDHVRGRVMAVEAVFIGASNELGAFESGALGQAIGAPASIAFGGFATIGVVAAFTVLFPSLRRIDRFDDLIDPANSGLFDPAQGLEQPEMDVDRPGSAAATLESGNPLQ